MATSQDQMSARRLQNELLHNQFPNHIHIIPESRFLLHVHTKIRSHETSRPDFLFYSDQLIRRVIEFAFETIDYDTKSVTTPTQVPFHGLEIQKSVIGVSIVRSGEVMEAALRSTVRQVKIGKILLQRKEESSFEGTSRAPSVFYAKLPSDMSKSTVMLMDPMLGTGGTACMAIQTLISSGVREKDIRFVSLICTAEGVTNVMTKFPKVQIITSMVDDAINAEKFIVPGVGDFSDRYFGTGSS